MHRRAETWRDAALWLGVYLAAVALPLFALLPGAPSLRRGFMWDFAIALGYAGLAMLGIQFVLTARFRRATAPFGIDIVYSFHRYLAVLALGIVCAHYAIVRWRAPSALGRADPRFAPVHMTAGRVALVLFTVLVVMSLARRRLRLEYDRWRMAHASLATMAYAAALSHLLGSGRFLDSAWKEALWAGYGTFWLALILYVRVARPFAVARAPWRVTHVRAERGGVWTLVLDSPGGARLRFAPGQFVWLTLRASPFAMREHPFSIASSAAHPERIELSIKELGDFTSTIKTVRPGERVWLAGPHGAFSVDRRPNAPGYVFVAGGIGIAPIMSMLRTLADRGDRRPLLLVYGNRVWDRVAFRDELGALSGKLDLRVVHVLLEPPPEWSGEHGFVTRDVLERHLPSARTEAEYLLCGPTPMLAAAEAALGALGVPARHIRSEFFEWV